MNILKDSQETIDKHQFRVSVGITILIVFGLIATGSPTENQYNNNQGFGYGYGYGYGYDSGYGYNSQPQQPTAGSSDGTYPKDYNNKPKFPDMPMIYTETHDQPINNETKYNNVIVFPGSKVHDNETKIINVPVSKYTKTPSAFEKLSGIFFIGLVAIALMYHILKYKEKRKQEKP